MLLGSVVEVVVKELGTKEVQTIQTVRKTFDHFYRQNICHFAKIFLPLHSSSFSKNVGTGTCSCAALLLLLLMAQDMLTRFECLSHVSGRWNKCSWIICPLTSSGLIKKEQ